VDIDQKSPTFRQSFSAILSSENHKQIWAPGGYAHGFCVLSDVADVFYKCTNFYSPEHETGIVWNDSTLKIQWPINNPILSEKDLGLPTLEEFLKD
jgi:dTDP-4-dehydrorhamnose 3,5-epimerase